MKYENKLGVGIVLGIAFGSVIGIITGNHGLWIALGIIFGTVIGKALTRKKRNDNKS